MSKDYRTFLDIDVLEAAKQRIDAVLESFDSYAVAFSGGKDSLVVLNLVKERMKAKGITKPLTVIFRDEEVIPDDVINFVNEIRLSGEFDFRYFCIPLQSEKYILGVKYSYIQWDKNRKHIREMPEYAITTDKVMSQYESDVFCTQGLKGKIALFNGIRADESLLRLQSVLIKKVDSYIADTDAPHIKFIKPIYDWTENDVFKFFYDTGIKYCDIYDAQMWNGEALRVSTPLHAESAKRFYKIKTRYPIFYQQLIDIFPEMLVQDRYFKELDRSKIYYAYPYGWNGIFKYIEAEIDDPKMKKKAKKEVMLAMQQRANKEKRGELRDNCGGYPILYVFKQIVGGAYKRRIMPCSSYTKEMQEYEDKVKNSGN